MSKYPREAFAIPGGCACGSVRYTIAVPPIEERGIMLPSADSNGQGDIRLPQTAICHCGDCRSRSGGLVLFALLAPFKWTTFSVRRKEETSGSESTERLEFLASDKFPPDPALPLNASEALEGTYFQMHRSSDKAMRCFCSVCSLLAGSHGAEMWDSLTLRLHKLHSAR